MNDDTAATPPNSHDRSAARVLADNVQKSAQAAGDPLAWFDELYLAANGDPALVPWAKLEPHPVLAEWIGRSGHLHEGSAIDVGCGLGDNAEYLDEAGYDVTAFDLSQTAIDWARRRHPATAVSYHQADLFNLPSIWRGAFTLVHECYTIQALDAEIRRTAMAHIAALVAPGGTLLVICRSRAEDETAEGPPWPLARSELEPFVAAGLEQTSFEHLTVTQDRPIPHFRATYRRAVT